MTYRFSNSTTGFGYDSTYRIPYARYQLILGDTVRAKKFYSQEGAWEGSCSGMAGSSALFAQENSGFSVTSFSPQAGRPYDLNVNDENSGWNMSLRDFIEAMQLVQFDARFITQKYWNSDCLEDIPQEVKRFQESGEDPIIVGVHGNQGGHALLAYGLVEASAAEERVMVYDCNYPDEERYITLDKDPASGEYTDWHYSLNDHYNYSSKTCGNSGETSGEGLEWMPSSEYRRVWENAMSTTENYSTRRSLDPGADSAMLFFNSDNAEIRDVENNLVATVKDGKLIPASGRTDIIPLKPLDILSDTDGNADRSTALLLPADLYTITSTETNDAGADQKPFEATMVHVDQSATVSAPGGSSVTFAVTDEEELNFARVSGEGSLSGEYAITLESSLVGGPESSPTGESQFPSVTMRGSIDEGAPSLSQECGQLSMENGSNASILINNQAVSSETLKSGGKLNLPAFLSTGLDVALQDDGRTVLFRDPLPAGTALIYAASYDSQGRMVEILSATPKNGAAAFSKKLSGTVRLFLLDANASPLCQSIPLTTAKNP